VASQARTPRTSKLHPSEIAHFEAQARRELAEADKLKAETREAAARARNEDAAAKTSMILYDREAEKRAKELAANEYHRVYVFDEAVTEGTVKKCINQLTLWARQDPECAIEIQINSPGGSIFDGFALIDFIRDLRERGHEVTTVALGMAASMGGVLLQAGDTRIMGANCFLLIHEGSLGAIGDFGEVEDRVKLMEQLHERILALFEERAKPINAKTTKAWIKRNWQRRDWWIDAQAAADYGFIDEVR